ncbi:hypothetical protein SETIT_1G323600v2 [Setaria italica]|uniref:Uncharacterized protein n=1 Tax=Setaria italica TaxID=4555 RepID=A0A368PRN0_SETIT|nr:hypothetical protein SETIT_1G323600v2 [Setaria italica]
MDMWAPLLSGQVVCFPSPWPLASAYQPAGSSGAEQSATDQLCLELRDDQSQLHCRSSTPPRCQSVARSIEAIAAAAGVEGATAMAAPIHLVPSPPMPPGATAE